MHKNVEDFVDELDLLLPGGVLGFIKQEGDEIGGD